MNMRFFCSLEAVLSVRWSLQAGKLCKSV